MATTLVFVESCPSYPHCVSGYVQTSLNTHILLEQQEGCLVGHPNILGRERGCPKMSVLGEKGLRVCGSFASPSLLMSKDHGGGWTRPSAFSPWFLILYSGKSWGTGLRQKPSFEPKTMKVFFGGEKVIMSRKIRKTTTLYWSVAPYGTNPMISESTLCRNNAILFTCVFQLPVGPGTSRNHQDFYAGHIIGLKFYIMGQQTFSVKGQIIDVLGF